MSLGLTGNTTRGRQQFRHPGANVSTRSSGGTDPLCRPGPCQNSGGPSSFAAGTSFEAGRFGWRSSLSEHRLGRAGLQSVPPDLRTIRPNFGPARPPRSERQSKREVAQAELRRRTTAHRQPESRTGRSEFSAGRPARTSQWPARTLNRPRLARALPQLCETSAEPSGSIGRNPPALRVAGLRSRPAELRGRPPEFRTGPLKPWRGQPDLRIGSAGRRARAPELPTAPAELRTGPVRTSSGAFRPADRPVRIAVSPARLSDRPARRTSGGAVRTWDRLARISTGTSALGAGPAA